ncbi:MAG: efflux RND transporter permease subunit [Gammaproteobacteria bacterium]|nr:efflux RND transporter permease subunit [Gammaproteobacteria bacterium]
MNFVEMVERHWRSLLFTAFAATLAGAVAAINLPIQLFPTVSFPRIRIEVDSGKMPAKTMLIKVTEPLEKVARAVPGAVNVESTTTRGSAQIYVDFPWGHNMTNALLRVETAFAQKLPDLPAGTAYHALQMAPNALMPFVSFALISNTVPPAELQTIAKYQIAPLLTGIPGIRKVSTLGGQTNEVEVYVSPEQLQTYGLTPSDVAKAISGSNSLSAVGRLEDNDLLYLVLANNPFRSIRSVRNVTLRTKHGDIVRLGDIARVEMGSIPQWLLVDNDGQPSVNINVFQQDNADSLKLKKEVIAKLDAFMKKEPKGIIVHKWYDQTDLVSSSIGAMEEAIVIGLVFAACVVLGFLRNWRAALVAMITVPMSVLTTCVLLIAFGMTFNIMTLGGIAAAIGLLIDDAIVMVEHISRRAGVPGTDQPHRAVFGAAREFLAPLTGSSVATIIMFIPLAFLSGLTGAFFKFLSITMASSLIISFAFTVLLVPVMARGLIDFKKWHDPSHNKDNWMRRLHVRLLGRLFARPWLAIAILGVVAGVGYVGQRHVGSAFLPKMDEGGFVLDYQTAPSTSLVETNRELETVEAILEKDPYVDTFSRRTGAGLGGDLNLPYQGDFFVELVPPSRRPPIWTVMAQIRKKIDAAVPGLNYDTHQLLSDMIGDMVGRRQPVVINLSAKNPDVLPGVATKVADAIAHAPGIQPSSVNPGTLPTGDALNIHVNEAQAAMNDLTVSDIKDQVARYLRGDVVTDYMGVVQPVGVRIWSQPQNGRFREYSRLNRTDIKNLLIRAPNRRTFPLGSVAAVKFVYGQPALFRRNLAQIIPVTAETSGELALSTTITSVKKILTKVVPHGVYYTLGGAYKQEAKAAHGMMIVFAAVVLAEVILLLFLYESWWFPVIILGTSILSAGAVFFGLWVTGVELNITAMMGMVMILGIAVEMSIFLFSEFQNLRQTMPSRQAIYEAALNRFRPIIMSTLAMILALLPLGAAISGSGDQMLQPLAVAIIAGILVQLPLVVLVQPVLVGWTLPKEETPPVPAA